MAPVDRRAQRLQPRQRAALPAGQQVEAVGELSGDALDRQDAHARGGQLDGERDAIEVLADLGDAGSVVACDHEVRPNLDGALDEQAHGVGVLQRLKRLGCLLGWQRQRRHTPRCLPPEPERLTAGRHHGDVRAASQQRVGELSARLEDMLAVVKQHERAEPRQVKDCRLDRRSPR